MIEAISNLILILNLGLQAYKKLEKHDLMISLCPFIVSIYYLIKRAFHLYYKLTLRDARRNLLKTESNFIIFFKICGQLLFLIYIYLCKPSQELIILFFTFIIILFHRLFYKPSQVESDDLNLYNDLSLGYGAALCYYENYLKYVLREKSLDLVTRIRIYKSKEGVKNMSNKLFILIPFSCYVKTYIDNSEHIYRSKELPPLEKNISGIPDRKFNITVYHIRYLKKSFHLALEYAQPLKVLYSWKEKGLISLEEMLKQREIFIRVLQKQITEGRSAEKICLVEYDDRVPDHELCDVLVNEKNVFNYDEEF